MIVVKEEKGTLGTYYDLYVNNLRIKKIFIQRIKQALEDKDYIFLINSDGIVIKNVFSYINFSQYLRTINSKEVAANALKILFSYSEIISKNIEEFTRRDVQNLSEFILGICSEGNTISFELKTSRSNNTHNIYFDIIRKFLENAQIKNENFFEQIVIGTENVGFGILSHTKKETIKKYKINKHSTKIYNNTIPKYIRVEEYKKIINLLDKENSIRALRDKIIINLMYTRGLRLGEVLGITFEDIKINKDDNRAGILYIRNRLSDQKYQMAKSCYKPRSKLDYKTRVYKENNYGFQTIILPPTLMDDINRYKDNSRDIDNLSLTVIENIFNESIADTVESNNEDNFYLFLNKNGKPLSSVGWNKRLKELFNSVGIQVDVNIKKSNLSHRFRHGFAMFLINKEKKNIEYVQKQMRHKSISSTLIYYNPEESEILKDTLKLQQNLRDIIEYER